jgi:phage-related minor tail protein
MSDNQNPKIQAEIGLNADPALKGFESVKKAGRDAAQSLAESGERASKAIAGPGDSAESSAKKIVQAESRIEASLKRRIALEEASLKGQRAIDEARISNRGADPAKFAPYLDQLERIRQQQDAVRNSMLNSAKSLDYVGLSAKQTTAALRQVPAQFTDIIVSLQGGQAPLTVLLQQGGQLRDVFGSVGNVVKALSSTISGFVASNPLSAVAAAAGVVAFAFEKGAQEQREFQKTLILTGGAAGVTAGQLSDIAAQIDQFSGATQGKAAEALNIFANAGIKGADNLQRFTAAAIEFERAGGGSIEKVAENFAKLGKDPLKASLELNNSMNFLTKSLYEQIKALEDQGRGTEAARLAQEAYNAALNDRTPQLLQNLGLIERGWNAIKDATKGAYDALLDIGRPQTNDEAIAALRSQLAARQERNASLGIADGKATQNIKDELYGREEMARLEAKSASLEAQKLASVKAAASWDEVRSKFLTREEQLTRTITDLRTKANAALKRADGPQQEKIKAELAAAEAEARASASKGGSSRSSSISDSELTNLKARVQQEQIYLELIQQRGLAADKLNEGERAAIKLQNELNGKLEPRVRAQKELALEQAKLLGQTIAQSDAEKEAIRIKEQAIKNSRKAYEDQLAIVEKSVDSLREQTEKELEAANAAGKSKEQIAALAAAKLEELAITKDRLAALEDERDDSGELAKKYREEAKALRELAEAKKIRATSETNAEIARESERAFEKMQEDARRAAESINNSLTDAILRSFESGKSFAETFRDTLKNMFKTLVLKPVIQFALAPITGGLQSLFGGGSGAAGGGLGGLGSLFGGFGNFGAGIGAGFNAARGEGGFGGAFSAAGAAFGAGNFSGGLGTGLGAIGAAMPYIGGALALFNAFRHRATPHLGSDVNVSEQGQATTNRGGYLAGNFNQQTDDALRFLGLGSVGSLNTLSQIFGGSGGFSANLQFAADGKDASPGDFVLRQNGSELFNLGHEANGGPGYKLYGNNQEEAMRAFFSDVSRGTLEAAREMAGLPAYVRDEFARLNDDASLEQIGALVDQIGVFQTQLSNMQLAIGSLGAASDEALSSIIKSAGGMQQFGASVDSYWANFFSDEERLNFGLSQLSNEFDRLGVELPETRQGFRDLVEGIDTSTESGQRLYASLINLNDEFASLVPAADAAQVAVEQIVVSAQQAFQALPTYAAYGSYVQDGVTYITGNATDLAAAANSAGSALQSASNAFAGLGDAITDEIKRIRGVLTGGDKASALASFATLTAQTRAGDLEAGKLLPSASQAYIKAVEESASSLLEVRRAQGFALSSLMETRAIIGQGPAVSSPTTFTPNFTPSYSPSGATQQNNDALIAEVKLLRERVDLLVTSAQTTAEVLDKASRGNQPLAVEVQ